MTRLLITGSHGFVGNALFERLRAEGCDPLRVSRQALRPSELAVGEIDLTTDWSMAFIDGAVVIHLAARVHVMNDTATDPLTAFRAVNVDGTLNLARQAVAARVKRFVFISSVKVNGESTDPGKAFSEADTPNPQNPYGISKHEAEVGLREIARTTGMQVVIIRPTLVYGKGVKGNFKSLMKLVASGIPLPLAFIHNLRSFVGIDNLVDFIVTCITHPAAANETFLVSDGEDLSTPDLIRRMARAMNRPARLLSVPVWTLKVGASLIGKGGAVQRLCGNLQVDISKSRTLLGWNPPFSVDEGLKRAVGGN